MAAQRGVRWLSTDSAAGDPLQYWCLVTGLAAFLRAACNPSWASLPLGTFYAAVAVIGWFWGVSRPCLPRFGLLGPAIFVFLRAHPVEPNLPSRTTGLCHHLCGRNRTVLPSLRAPTSAGSGTYRHASAARPETSCGGTRIQRKALSIAQRSVRFGMWSADTEGRLTFVSPRFLDFFVLPLEPESEDWWSGIQAPPHEIREAKIRWEHCKKSGESWNWEYPVRGRDAGAQDLEPGYSASRAGGDGEFLGWPKLGCNGEIRRGARSRSSMGSA